MSAAHLSDCNEKARKSQEGVAIAGARVNVLDVDNVLAVAAELDWQTSLGWPTRPAQQNNETDPRPTPRSGAGRLGRQRHMSEVRRTLSWSTRSCGRTRSQLGPRSWDAEKGAGSVP